MISSSQKHKLLISPPQIVRARRRSWGTTTDRGAVRSRRSDWRHSCINATIVTIVLRRKYPPLTEHSVLRRRENTITNSSAIQSRSRGHRGSSGRRCCCRSCTRRAVIGYCSQHRSLPFLVFLRVVRFVVGIAGRECRVHDAPYQPQNKQSKRAEKDSQDETSGEKAFKEGEYFTNKRVKRILFKGLGSLVVRAGALFSLNPFITNDLALGMAETISLVRASAFRARRTLLCAPRISWTSPPLLFHCNCHSPVNLALLVSQNFVTNSPFYATQVDFLHANGPIHGLRFVSGVIDDIVRHCPSIPFLDGFPNSNAITKINGATEGMVRGTDAVSGRRVRPGMSCTKLGPGGLLYHFLDIALIPLPLISTQLFKTIFVVSLFTVAHDSSQAAALANTENLGVWTEDLNFGLRGVTAASTTTVTLRRINETTTSILFEFGNWQETIPACVSGTLAGVASNSVSANSPGSNIALRDELWTLSHVLINIDGTLVNIFDHNSPRDAGIRRISPRGRNSVVDVKLTNVRETSWW
mmetsp:Transcript_26622/g.58342  ORF Transcript_26622/g.58342 Transcript_26622/m.58342 type:complete len:527 (+) Transcript_26622:179-1759(+)